MIREVCNGDNNGDDGMALMNESINLGGVWRCARVGWRKKGWLFKMCNFIIIIILVGEIPIEVKGNDYSVVVESSAWENSSVKVDGSS